MRSKKNNVNYRELAHKELDDWIDDVESPGLMLAHGMSKENPQNLWLGSLAKAMVEARRQAKSAFIEIEGKRYLIATIKREVNPE